MRVGVTGASGHLGNVACRILRDRGHEVKAMYRSDKRAIENQEIEVFQGDVLDANAVDQFVEGCDVIIHSAAIISIYGDPTGIVFKTNTEGPKNIISAVMKHGVGKLIHISSTHAVLEHPLDQPFDETRPYKQPHHFAYDYSKATGEQIVLDAIRSGKIKGVVLRPSSVIGLHDYKPSEIGKALIDFYNRKIPTLPPGGYNFIDVRDVARTVCNAVDAGKNGEIYLMSGQFYSLREFAAIVNKVSGVKVPKMVVPFWLLKGALPFVKLYGKMKQAAPLFTIEAITALKLGHPDMKNDKAKAELGHEVRDLEETIRDFYEWQRKQGVID